MVVDLPIAPMLRTSKPGTQRCGPKRCRLAVNSELRDVVASKLMLDWSPEQISGWLKSQYPHNESVRVSHETIYRSLFTACAARVTPANMDTPEGRSSMLSRSGKDRQKRKTERFPVIGKAICWRVGRTAILRR
jgi:IS30 family transposase